jgi:hypothetical protein
MQFCLHCWRQGRLSPVETERFRAGQRGFECRWCGRQSGEAVSDAGGNLGVVNLGTLPSDRFAEAARLSRVKAEPPNSYQGVDIPSCQE